MKNKFYSLMLSKVPAHIKTLLHALLSGKRLKALRFMLMIALFHLAFIQSYKSSYAQNNIATYSTAGTYTWTCPAGVYSVTVRCWGGGGAGGSVQATSAKSGGGGGAGGSFAQSITSVIPGQNYTVVVGAGGTGVSLANGNPGGSSSFNTSTVVAVGGPGGHYVLNGAGATTSGSTSGDVGTVLYAGGTGGAGTSAGTSKGGGGGGGAGIMAAGGNASGATAGGGGISGGGAGAAGPSSSGSIIAGSAGSAPGGGGSGGVASAGGSTLGGAGGAGQVIIEVTGIPIEYYSFEDYSTRGTGVATSETSVNAQQTALVLGPAVAYVTGTNSAWNAAGGKAIQCTAAGVASCAISGGLTTNCINVPLNTTGFQGITVFFNYETTSATSCSCLSYVGYNYSLDGGTTWTFGGYNQCAANSTWYGTYVYLTGLSASCENNPNLMIQFYSICTSCAIDNVILYASQTNTSAGNLTLPDFGRVYDGINHNASSPTGGYSMYDNFTVQGSTTNVTLTYANFGTNGLLVESGATFTFGTAAAPTQLSATSSVFTILSGGTLNITSLNGISSGTTIGNIRCQGTRTFDPSANYNFIGNTPQGTGTGFPSATNNITINNAAGVTLSNPTSLQQQVNGTLTMTSGTLTLGTTNLAIGTLAGGPFSASNMIVQTGSSGGAQLTENLPSSGSSQNLIFPVGTGTNYNPANFTFTSNSTARNIGAVLINSADPNNISPPDYAHIYWHFTDDQAGNGSYAYNGTFNYTGNAETGIDAYLKVNLWNGSSWVQDGSSETSLHTLTSSSGFWDYNGTNNNGPLGGSDITPADNLGEVTCTFAGNQVSNVNVTQDTFTSEDISWTPGDGDATIIIVNQNALDADPIGFVAYSNDGGNEYNNGNSIVGTSYVVYNGTGSSVTITNLLEGQTYTYAVYSYYTSTDCYKLPGVTGSFNTLSCAPILLPSSSSTSICSNVAFTLDANPISGTGSTCGSGIWEYTWSNGSLYWDGTGFTQSDISTAVYSTSTTITTSINVNTTFTAYVRCQGTPSCNNSSNPHSVSVIALPAAPACVPAPTYPANSSSVYAGNVTSLTWSVIGGATSYDVYFGTSSTPPFIQNQAENSYNPGCLSANTTYYWLIVPKNSTCAASGCTTWSFTTDSTFMPASTPSFPGNGANWIFANSCILNWTASAGATGYDVYLDINNPPTTLVSSNQSGLTFNTSSILPSTTYYWEIVPKLNSCTEATNYPIWSFNTSCEYGIYQQNFDGLPTGNFHYTAGSEIDGWLASFNGEVAHDIFGDEDQDLWAIYNNNSVPAPITPAISGNSVGISAYYNGALAGPFAAFINYAVNEDMRRSLNTTGFQNTTIHFDWQSLGNNSGGQVGTVYGSVVYNTTGNWSNEQIMTTGGYDGLGHYYNTASTAHADIQMPSACDNNANFAFGFNYQQPGNPVNSYYPIFIVDNIAVTGCPVPGTLSPLTTSFAGSATPTPITVSGYGAGAMLQWQQSTDGGNTWTNVTTGSGATTATYTTSAITVETWYRCQVYYSTCCTGAYQSQNSVFVPDLTPLNGVYTIDNTQATNVAPPTNGRNFNSFTDAISILNAAGISGSVTFNAIAGETYIEDPPVITTTGTSSWFIKFVKFGSGANPVIKPTGGPGASDAGIAIEGGSYITFNGIDISVNSGSAVEYGYYIFNASATQGAQHDTIMNATITLNKANLSTSCIWQSAATTPTAFSGANSYNKYLNLTLQNAAKAVYWNGNAIYRDTQTEFGGTNGGQSIIGGTSPNDINNGGGQIFAFEVNNQDSYSIHNMDFKGAVSAGSNAIGIVDWGSTGTSNVYDNFIHGIKQIASCNCAGYNCAMYMDAVAGATINFYNNMVYDCDEINNYGSGSQVLCILFRMGASGNTGTFNVYNNSFRQQITYPGSFGSTVIMVENQTLNLKNNIISNLTPSGTYNYSIMKGTSSTVTSDYNDLYLASGSIGFWNTTDPVNHGGSGTTEATLANWQAAQSGIDAHSINTTPTFVSNTSPYDLHMNPATSCAFNGAAIPINPPVATDIDGDMRDPVSPDIGADEFTPTGSPAITGNTTACIGDIKQYTTASGQAGYVWSVSSGGTITSGSGSDQIQVTWNNAGSQWVSVTYTGAGCSTPFSVSVVSTCNFNYTVTAFLQGYYLGGSTMSPLLYLLDPTHHASTDVDTVVVELHNGGTVYSTNNITILQTNGTISCTFPGAGLTGTYYIVVKHRNSITTWSASAQTLTDGGSYSFAGGSGQAYGSTANLQDGNYGIYSGDVNQDGTIDTSDRTAMQSVLSTFAVGVYDLREITGDGFVDEDDYRILQNNIPLGITATHP